MLAGSKLMNRLLPLHVLNEAEQVVGRFLAGFQVQGLAVLGQWSHTSRATATTSL